jgi:nitrate/TMAO reductase-like tetraheme cytochrome c subunit
MANDPPSTGFLARAWRWLRTPSARWSVLALLLAGLLIGVAGVVGTQVMVAATGTNEFCGGACHSMEWVASEFKQSGHFANQTGVQAGCHDCHVPHAYPELLWYKAKAGAHDAIAEVRGVISTEDKFKKERTRLAHTVWTEFRETDSANCRTCHAFTPEVLAKQKDLAQKMHAGRKADNKTCIDCHTGVAHTAPDE